MRLGFSGWDIECGACPFLYVGDVLRWLEPRSAFAVDECSTFLLNLPKISPKNRLRGGEGVLFSGLPGSLLSKESFLPCCGLDDSRVYFPSNELRLDDSPRSRPIGRLDVDILAVPDNGEVKVEPG